MKNRLKQRQRQSAAPEDNAGPASDTLTGLISEATEKGVKLVRFLFCDASSAVRGKASSIGSVKDRFHAGIGLVKGSMAQNMLDQLASESGLGATGEVRLVPDSTTFKILPYTEASAAVLCDLIELDGKPWSVCPRSFLKKQIALATEQGLFIRAAFEPEFIAGSDVAEGYGVGQGDFVPIDRGQCFSVESMNSADVLITKIVAALETQGLEVEQYYPELGHGQHEISIKHSPALEAADRYILMRETIRGIASQTEYSVTFTPKLSEDDPGNGCHLHISAWDENYGTNLFAIPFAEDENNGNKNKSKSKNKEEKDPTEHLSDLAGYFIAGVLDHLPGLLALTCASVNSYRRLQPRSWASAYTCWGLDNREAALRVPSTYWGAEEASTNIEIKCVDNTANPYLALGAVIACGLDGIQRKLTPPPPVQGDPADLSESEMAAGKVQRLPESLKTALAALQADGFLMETLGEDLARTFIAVKKSEIRAFAGDSDFEFNMHKLRY